MALDVMHIPFNKEDNVMVLELLMKNKNTFQIFTFTRKKTSTIIKDFKS